MFRRLTVLSTVASFMFLQACGTILKTDQIGRPHSGRIDLRIAVLDAIGLFLFVVPGIVAFTVDYLNGTIYLPTGRTAQLESVTPENIQRVLQAHNINVSLEELQRVHNIALQR